MQNRFNNFTQMTTHIILFVVSTILSCTMYSNLVDPLWQKPIMVLLGLGNELLKMHLLNKMSIDGKTVLRVLTYIGLALISGVATMSFSIGSISSQSQIAEYSNVEIISTMNDIESYDRQIENMLNSSDTSLAEKVKMNNMDDAFYTGLGNMDGAMYTNQEMINILQEDKADAIVKLNFLMEGDGLIVSSLNSFVLMSFKINSIFGTDLTEEDIVFYLFLFIVILLETGLVVSYGGFSSIEDITQKEIISFLNAFVQDKNTVICEKKKRKIIKQYDGKINRKQIQTFILSLSSISWKGTALFNKEKYELNRSYIDTVKLIENLYKE